MLSAEVESKRWEEREEGGRRKKEKKISERRGKMGGDMGIGGGLYMCFVCFSVVFHEVKGNCVDWRGCWCVFRSVFVFLCFFCFSLFFSYYSIGWGVVGVVGGLQRGFTSCSVDVDQCGVCVQRCALLCGPHKHQHLAMCMERSS